VKARDQLAGLSLVTRNVLTITASYKILRILAIYGANRASMGLANKPFACG
jgi:hypothetical protein